MLVFASIFLYIASTHAISRKLITPLSDDGQLDDGLGQDEPEFWLTIGLPLSNTKRGVSSLLDISDPESKNYGQHWTAAEVARIFKPAADSREAVLKWLHTGGLGPEQIRQSLDGGRLYVPVNATGASRLFNREIDFFKDREEGKAGAEPNRFELPKALDRHVDYIAAERNTKGRLSPNKEQIEHRKQSRQDAPDILPGAIFSCNDYTTPLCLRQLYGIPNDVEPNSNNTFGIFTQAWGTWSPYDLDVFFAYFAPERLGQRSVMAAINGGYRVPLDQPACRIGNFFAEATLDYEYAIALAGPQDVIDIQVGDYLPANLNATNLNSMLAAFDKYYCGTLDPEVDNLYHNSGVDGDNLPMDCGTVQPPNVVSVSYTWAEADYPPEYLQRQCFEYLKLGLMGVSFIVSVSDHGTSSGGCIDTETGETNATTGRFNPTFPSSCPWVTTVAGTQLTSQPRSLAQTQARQKTPYNGGPPQVTAFRYKQSATLTYTSGGGFSNVFAAPVYQYDAIQQYKNLERDHLSTFQDAFNATGRGFPDVSALANSYLTFYNSKMSTLMGSSASTPVFASIISLINSERMNAGKRPLGFLNPIIWKYPQMLNDIVQGANEGCGVDPAFQANEGWDPVTGWGSPDYGRMRDTLLNLP